jgi:ankyrin repeat protein
MRPLGAALARKHFQTADLLHHNGADLDVRGFNENSPLNAAIRSRNFEVARMLIEYNPAYINAGDVDGWTPLYWVSGRYDIEDSSLLRLLLEHGADINVQKRGGSTPLHRASANGALKVVRLLLEHGADVEVKDDRGKTALRVAGGKRRDEVMKLLREHGAK